MQPILEFQTATKEDTRKFLTTITTQDQERAVQLWDAYSGYKGVLNSHMDAHSSKGYVFNPDNGSYTSRFEKTLSRKDLRYGVLRVTTAVKKDIRKETAQLLAGTIILSVWYNRTRELLKSLYYTIWLLSIGGLLFDNTTQRSLFYLFVLSQFQYLDNFATQLADEEEDALISAIGRSGMYASWGNVEYQNIFLERAIEDGYTEGRRVLGENENHCTDGERPGCIEEAAKGWMPIRQVLPFGEAQCYSHDLCYLEVRRSP